MKLWEFQVVVDENGVSMILMCDQWESMLPLLRHRSFFLDDIELLFLNQVSNNFNPFFALLCGYLLLTVNNGFLIRFEDLYP